MLEIHEHDDSGTLAQMLAMPLRGFDRFPGLPIADIAPRLRVALIDANRFRQECLVKAFAEAGPDFAMTPLAGIRDCLLEATHEFDIALYYCTSSGADTASDIAALRLAIGEVPLLVLSDAADEQQMQSVRAIIRLGARGFIPTRSTSMPTIIAAIRFVRAGGSYVPIELLLAAPGATPTPAIPLRLAERLTRRQAMVLDLLQQGKANKIIAHELDMSESTVKVHVRNIMRKMGATNRTQVAFKAHTLQNQAHAFV